MNVTVPVWVDVLSGVLVLVGAFTTLVGSFGLARLRSFFQRMHAPTLGATVGVWSISLATALQFSFVRGQVYVHALLIALFAVVTFPITTIFLMRAGVFRVRVKAAMKEGELDVPEAR